MQARKPSYRRSQRHPLHKKHCSVHAREPFLLTLSAVTISKRPPPAHCKGRGKRVQTPRRFTPFSTMQSFSFHHASKSKARKAKRVCFARRNVYERQPLAGPGFSPVRCAIVGKCPSPHTILRWRRLRQTRYDRWSAGLRSTPKFQAVRRRSPVPPESRAIRPH